jgi:transposase-like protein
MPSRVRRRFSDEFKSQAVARVVEQGHSVSQVTRELDLVDSVLRRWIEESSQPHRPLLPSTTAPLSAEQAELQHLRRENQILRMERDILKKATAFFAKEST